MNEAATARSDGWAQLDQMDDKARQMNMVKALGLLKGIIVASLRKSFPEADEKTCLRAALRLMVEIDAQAIVFLRPEEEPSP